jgi:hypothetical protein
MSAVSLDDALELLLERVDFLASLDRTPFFDIEVGAPLDTDDAALEPLALSRTATLTLAAAFQHLGALRALLGASGEATSAVFSCLRAALDASAVAIWMLEPESAVERHTRFLSDAWGDIRDADRLVTALAGSSGTTTRAEEDWSSAHRRALGAPDPAGARLPVSPARRLETAATVVADFTRVPGAAAIIRSGWQGLAAIGRGRSSAYGLDDTPDAARAMLAGTLSMTLDVAETAASLFHVRAVVTTAAD